MDLELIQKLLTFYGGEVPHGPAGDEMMRSRQQTAALETTPENIRRDLQPAEIDDILAYMGWNLWDQLAMRGTEGESGLVPRQEYEAVGTVQTWRRYPEFMEVITDAVGVDGIVDMGATSRREIGTKANLLHIWCTGIPPAFGRGILVGLGMAKASERTAELAQIMQFCRQLYHGLWGGGPMYASSRQNQAALLDSDWLDRFAADRVALDDADRRGFYQGFSATVELLGFLLNLDNRLGLSDTGPYPLPGGGGGGTPAGDGGFMLVRDHFLSEDVYHWFDVAEGLPHAITQAMFFQPPPELRMSVLDIGTCFADPPNYLPYLTGMAIYARDRWDTPVSEVRRLDETEMASIQAKSQDATMRLYGRLANMPRRDKIWAGAQVYATDFLLPWARLAGVWPKLVTEHDFFEADPVTSEAYYRLTDGTAAELVPRLFIAGGAFMSTSDDAGS